MVEKSDHDMLYEIHTVLLGTNGQGGLCRAHECLKKDFHRFKLWVIIILATGVTGGGIGIWKGVEALASITGVR